MVADDEEERAVLARARRGLSPTNDDTERVRLGTLAVLGGGAPNPRAADGTAGSPFPSRPTGAGNRLADLGERVAVSKGRLLAVLLITGAGGIGYHLGLEAGRAEARAEGQVVVVRASPSVVPEQARLAEVRSTPPSFAISPERPATSFLAKMPHRDSGVAVAGAADHMDEEVRTLGRVERALRDHNPSVALALLDELDHSVPRGKLLEERQAARAIASCAIEPSPVAKASASTFAKHYPSSVYLKRVEQACGDPPESER